MVEYVPQEGRALRGIPSTLTGHAQTGTSYIQGHQSSGRGVPC